MTKLTWDNPVLIGPAMAARMGLKTEDVVELELNGKKVTAPDLDSGRASRQFRHGVPGLRPQARWARRQPALASTCTRCVTSATPWFATGVNDHQDRRNLQAGLDPGLPDDGHARRARGRMVRTATLEEYRKEPDFANEEEPPTELTLYQPYPYEQEALRLGHGD